MLYVVIAYDGTDPGTFERRMEIRPEHMANGERMMQAGTFIFGGATLDGGGKMCGGVLVVNFDSRESVDEWLREEPYILEKVWQRVEVYPFLVPPQFQSLFPSLAAQAAA